MANAEGGVIAVGFRAGTCEGIDDRPQAQNEWRQAGVNLTLPPVRFEPILLQCINAQGAADHALLLAIPPSSRVHSTTRDEVFLRTGDENRRLSFEQRIEFQYNRGDTSFEITPASTYGPSPLDADSSRLRRTSGASGSAAAVASARSGRAGWRNAHGGCIAVCGRSAKGVSPSLC